MATTLPVPSRDPTDLLFNAEKLDQVVNGVGLTYTTRLGVVRMTWAGLLADLSSATAITETSLNRAAAEDARDAAVAAQGAAEDARDDAEAARDAAIVAQNVGVIGFDTKAAMDGSLAYAPGVVALVTNDAAPANNTYYRKIGASGAGSWVQASAGEVDLLAARVQGVTEIFHAPNLYTDRDYSKLIGAVGADSSGAYAKTANASLATLSVNGRPGFAMSALAAAANSATWTIDIAAFGLAPGHRFSVSVRALATTVIPVSTSRILVRQLTSGSVEIPAARQTYNFTAGTLTADLAISFSNILIDATCAKLQVYFETNSTTTVFKFTDLLLAEGAVVDYRASPQPYVDDRAQAMIAAAVASGSLATELDITDALSPLQGRPNLLNNDWAAMVTTGSGTATKTATTVNGRPAVQLTNDGGSWTLDFQPGKFKSGNIVAGARVVARSATNAGRVLVLQYDASSAEIGDTRITLTPAVGATLPAKMSNTVALHANCRTVRMFIEAAPGAAGATATFQDVYLADGQEQVFRPYVAPISAREMYISSTGSDATGVGTATAPFATVDRAVSELGGTGIVWVLDGTYPAQSIRAANIKGRVDVRGIRSSLVAGTYTYPVFKLGAQITGITKTVGQAKVYQATVSGLPTLSNFQWVYQDGVADPRTVIANADRDPQHRGRTNRLSNFARIHKTVATTLAAALAEMDASSLPLAFVSGGVLYFTIVGGGDGTAATIYRDGSQNFIFGVAARGSCGELNLEGLDIRNGGVDLTSFKSNYVNELTVSGARADALAYNVLSYGTLEVSCAGSEDIAGDGLNGHHGSRLWGLDLYTHDNHDDGFSDHEGSTSRLFGGLVEYNGGGGLVPATGSDHVGYNFKSRRNQREAGRKSGAFCCAGAPTEGYDTRARWVGCVDIESDTSFFDSKTAGTVESECVNCKSIRPVTMGFNVTKIVDCGYVASGTSSPRHASTVVENTTLVT